MASIHIESPVDVSADTAWQALRRVGDADTLFSPVLTSAEVEGDMRTVRFANGSVIREQVLDIDDRQRRVAYAALDSPVLSYHHASMRIVEDGSARCRFLWTTDFLPADAASGLRPLIEAGTKALKANLERAADRRHDAGT